MSKKFLKKDPSFILPVRLYFVLLLLCVEEGEEEAQSDWRQNIYQSEKAPCPSAYSSNHFKSYCDFIEEIVVEKVALMFVIGLK